MHSKTIKKYQKKTISQLKNICVRWCHDYIRKRDEGNFCISCNKFGELQAGHYFPAGHHSALKFNENNIHGQCLQCNFHKHGNLSNYKINLELKIGKEELQKLEITAAFHKRTGFKWDRFTLIETIEYYKRKVKELL